MRCATGQQNSGKHGTFTGNQHHFKAKCFQFLSKGIHKVKKNIDNRHNLFHIFIMAVTSMRKKNNRGDRAPCTQCSCLHESGGKKCCLPG